ncbi:hypothetical protein ANN_16233 [Periplaneta americana]|uniref:Reverse transcriptase domain-containing protein n=1 Tax=Periplaneta americana TaxID=6978 RepID=A0ABQ8SIF3_PERAM|nr:hypothetical protein ANN_16233 [Periplaneta americana]
MTKRNFVVRSLFGATYKSSANGQIAFTFPDIMFSYFIVFRHPVGEIELSAAFCYELQASGKSRPQRIPTSFDVPTSDGSLPKANRSVCLCCDVHRFRFQSANPISRSNLSTEGYTVQTSLLSGIKDEIGSMTLVPRKKSILSRLRTSHNLRDITQEYAIRKVQYNTESLELNGLQQLLVYADDVIMSGENPQTIRKNAEILVEASKAIGLEVNPEKTKYMIMSHDQNIVRNGNIKIGGLSFEEVKKFKYLGATVTIINDTREEIKRRINMGNACYYSVEKLLSSSLLSKNLKVRIYKTIILPVVLYGCETWTLTLRDEQRLRVFENKMVHIDSNTLTNLLLTQFHGTKSENEVRKQVFIRSAPVLLLLL